MVQSPKGKDKKSYNNGYGSSGDGKGRGWWWEKLLAATLESTIIGICYAYVNLCIQIGSFCQICLRFVLSKCIG